LIIFLCSARAQQSQNPPQPAIEPVKTTITVTEHIATEAPASITTIGPVALEQVPGVNIDDRLRTVPGFTLFRRASSLVANPTTQGVSLRGLGGSGASRTLVLWDGVPMNDPFGGWVYWTRFPPEQIEQVEISRGASTSLFGDRAMGGAISILSHEVVRSRFDASYETGNENTHEVSAGAAGLWGKFAASARVRAFTTDGYFIVPSYIRGMADTRANVEFVAGNARLDYLGGDHRLFVKIDMLAEQRANGTVLQRNSTSLGTLSANYSFQRQHDGVSVVGFHTREDFRASFSAVSADRNTERLTYLQQVPSQATGAAAYWSHSGSAYTAIAGTDIEHDEGTSTDRLLVTVLRIGGGSRVQHGVFGQFNLKTGIVQWFAGAREHFTGGGDTFFSPSVGVVAGRGRWRARGSAYRSFRAPTLNELYREFRVGNADTLANPALRPETLSGGEAGFDFIGESRHFSVTLFRNSLDNLITNVTLKTSPTAITRQRQNAAAATAQGIESEFKQAWRNWRAELSYLYADSTYVTGFRIPQVPRNQGTAQLTYTHGGTLASFGIRSYSLQFEDDVHPFILPGFATLQFTAMQRLPRGFSVRGVVENLLDRQYLVGFSPTPTIGSPRLVRFGVRWH
jgi:outer membrane cobalamin receptor